jgi:signal transduction histidine kinase
VSHKLTTTSLHKTLPVSVLGVGGLAGSTYAAQAAVAAPELAFWMVLLAGTAITGLVASGASWARARRRRAEERAMLLNRVNTHLAQQLGALTEVVRQLEVENRELDRFARRVSHDLQAPLRRLNVFCELLPVHLREDRVERVEQDLAAISRSAGRMRDMTRAMLSLARADRAEMGEADLSDCVAGALEALGDQLEETGAELTIGALPVVTGDAALLTQLFQNLVGNALKYADAEPPVIAIAVDATDAGWSLRVSDRGRGLPAGDPMRLFEPFERGPDGGSGLGLSICQAIARRHGGAITARPSEGGGACFEVTLPR